MKKNNPPAPAPAPIPPPEPQPDIQMTPVEFAPPSSPDAVGVITGSSSKVEYRFPVFVPLLIVLLTLNFAVGRDIVALNKRMAAIETDNAPALDVLKQAGKQNEFVESLRDGLQKIAISDPTATQILKEYFPPPRIVKPDAPDTSKPQAK